MLQTFENFTPKRIADREVEARKKFILVYPNVGKIRVRNQSLDYVSCDIKILDIDENNSFKVIYSYALVNKTNLVKFDVKAINPLEFHRDYVEFNIDNVEDNFEIHPDDVSKLAEHLAKNTIYDYFNQMCNRGILEGDFDDRANCIRITDYAILDLERIIETRYTEHIQEAFKPKRMASRRADGVKRGVIFMPEKKEFAFFFEGIEHFGTIEATNFDGELIFDVLSNDITNVLFTLKMKVLMILPTKSELFKKSKKSILQSISTSFMNYSGNHKYQTLIDAKVCDAENLSSFLSECFVIFWLQETYSNYNNVSTEDLEHFKNCQIDLKQQCLDYFKQHDFVFYDDIEVSTSITREHIVQLTKKAKS